MTIGQTPRPDLVASLAPLLPEDVEVVEVGALDRLSANELPPPHSGGYPLTTRLRDGTPVTIDEADLAPLVQAAIDRGEAAGATVTLLLCAGGFEAVTGSGDLVRPFETAVEVLRAADAERIAVVVPIEAQVAPSMGKWLAAGFEPWPVVGAPASLEVEVFASGSFDAIVLDYVGHAPADVAALRARAPTPVIDLGEAGAAAAAARFR